MTIVRSFSRIGFFNRLIFSSSSFFFRINRWIKISSTGWMKRSSSGHRSLPFLVSQVDKFKMKFLARSCGSLPPRSTSPRNNREIHLAKSFHAMYIYIYSSNRIKNRIQNSRRIWKTLGAANRLLFRVECDAERRREKS